MAEKQSIFSEKQSLTFYLVFGNRNKPSKAKHCRALEQLRLFHASWNADESKFHYVILMSIALRYSHVYFRLHFTIHHNRYHAKPRCPILFNYEYQHLYERKYPYLNDYRIDI